VTQVESDSAAARAGIKVGAVILQVNRKPVTNPAEFVQAVNKGDKKLLLLVNQENRQRFVVLESR
jgi:serine protease Do